MCLPDFLFIAPGPHGVYFIMQTVFYDHEKRQCCMSRDKHPTFAISQLNNWVSMNLGHRLCQYKFGSSIGTV